ncbi:hypothetical protein TrRE_jg9726 [Triparma retinervis]|uniref:Uncharacterized protein n=1 Tax=Triparma retinervis TaxID=2557542 RepID=A0A9W6ZXT8_9STRA|nr:hypothetical protein TrRE_jg9726 [Triparma retinervis]
MAVMVDTATNIFDYIKDFVTQTAKVALTATILPLLTLLCLRMAINAIANTYFYSDRVFLPPIWASTNISAVPYNLSERYLMVVPPPGDMPPWHLWWNWTIAVCLYFTYFFRVLLLHKSSVIGKASAFFMTLGMTLTHGYLWQKEYEYQAVEGMGSENNPSLLCTVITAVAFPSTFACSFFFTEGTGGNVKKAAKVMSLLLTIGVLEAVVIFLLNGSISETFFNPQTGSFTRFLIRLCTPLVMKGVFMECCATWAPIISNILDTGLYEV